MTDEQELENLGSDCVALIAFKMTEHLAKSLALSPATRWMLISMFQHDIVIYIRHTIRTVEMTHPSSN